MRAKPFVIALTILTGVALGAFAWQYLAASFYFIAIKTWPGQIELGTYWTLWQQLADIPAQRKILQGAAGIAALMAFGVPLLIVNALAKQTRPLHGAARFAFSSEVRAADLNAEKGIIVGRYEGRYLVFGGQQFALLAAPTRSGKGVGVVIPNLLNWPDSVVVLDIKLENFEKTSGFRSNHGQEVFLFSPWAEDFRSHRWNPLSGISRDPNFRIGDIQSIGAIFYPSGGSAANSNEAFFNDQAQNLFMGIVLYLMDTPDRPCTMGEVFRQGSGNGQPIEAHFKAILAERSEGPNALSPACVDALNRFLSNSDNTLASIKASFDAPLLIFANPIVDAATSGDDFDLRGVRKKKLSIYLGIQPNRLEVASRLLNVFFAQLINLNTDTLPEHDARLKYQCLLIMDEFTSMGRIPIIAKSVAFIAGYGLRLLPIVQSIEQIEDTYGKENARNFVKNHDVKIVFPPDDIDDAEKVSRTLGYLTEKSTSTGESRSAGWGRGSNVSLSENTSDQKRALLLPQEVREMPRDQQIIFKTSCKPILATKNRYFDDPVFMARLEPPCKVNSMDMEHHRAVVEQRTRAVTVDELESIDLSKLTLNADAISEFTGDPLNPTEEEASAVVDSFFSQLDWEDEPNAPAEALPNDGNGPDEAMAKPNETPGLIDLSLLDM